MGYDGPGMARSHPWFKGYNWLDMYNQTAHSPFLGIVYMLNNQEYRRKLCY